MGAGLFWNWNALNYALNYASVLCSTLERETLPSLHPGHTHVPLFPKSQSGRAGNTVSLPRSLTCLPRGWSPLSGAGTFAQEPPSLMSFPQKSCLQAGNWLTNSCPGTTLELGCPCPRIKQPSLLFRLVINIIVNVAINSI